MRRSHLLHPSPDRGRSGSALLLVLSCVVLLTLLIVALMLVSRTDYTSSIFYSRGVNSKLLSENAVNIVIAQIRQATQSSGGTLAWASQPGMIRTYDTKGNPGTYYKLYSWDNMIGNVGGGGGFNVASSGETPQVGGASDWYTNKEVFTDLNEPVNGIYPIADPSLASTDPVGNPSPAVEGFYIQNPPQGASSNPLPMPVKWLYLLKDGTTEIGQVNSGNPSSALVTNASATNPIIGRIAFWTDDETCKVNINTASEGTFWSTPYVDNIEEHSNNGNYPYGYSISNPASNEYQRIPGHPAMTCLSAVLGSFLPLYSGGALATYPTNPPFSPYITNNGSDYNALSLYYLLSPRIGIGGSQGGSVSSNLASSIITPHTDRLYDSVDELRFAPNRLDTSASHSPLTPTALAKLGFFLTAHSRAPEVNLFGGPRISLWPLQQAQGGYPLQNAKDNLLAFCGTIAGLPYYFQRASVATTYSSSTQPATASGVSAIYNNSSLGSSQDSAADYAIARNQSLMSYLLQETSAVVPGFSDGTSTFATKYTGGDREQILTEMFDFIRSGINTSSVTLAPSYSYTPFGSNFYPQTYTPTSAGSVVPIKATVNGVNTKGFGRTYTIREVSIVFFASGWKDETKFTGDPPTLKPPSDPFATLFPGTFGFSPRIPPSTNPPNIAAPTSGSDGLPDDEQATLLDGSNNPVLYPPVSGTKITHYFGVGIPRTSEVQAYIIISPYSVNPGLPQFGPGLRYEISGLNNFTLNGASMGFPSDAFEVVRNKNDMNPTSEAGFINNLTSGNGVIPVPRSPSTSDSSVNRGTTTAPDATDSSETVYPFFSLPVSLKSHAGIAAVPKYIIGREGNEYALATYDLPKGYPASAGYHWDFGSASSTNSPTTMSFSGGTITLRIYRGNGNTITTGSDPNPDLIQEIKLTFPPAPALPIPQIARANPVDYGGMTVANNGYTNGTNSLYGGDPYVNPEFYSGFLPGLNATAYDSDDSATTKPINTRFTGSYLYTQPQLTQPDGITKYSPGITAITYGFYSLLDYPARRGDVVRSMSIVTNATNPSTPGPNGDMRLLAGLRSVPATYFQPTGGLANYTNSSVFQAGMMSWAYFHPGNYQYRQSYGFNENYSIAASPYPNGPLPGSPFDWDVTNNQPQTMRGVLAPTTYYVSGPGTTSSLKPAVAPDLNGAYLINGGVAYPGDWDSGIANFFDGPYLNKPDEGFASSGAQAEDVYFSAGNVVEGSNDVPAVVCYSPNRQISSPVAFGSLPTGVMSGKPWQTLLFNAYPAAGDHHPGFGVGTGGLGHLATAPYSVLPDHLLLDLFWMPVVEPYAISDPLATAGKVNMNFQIVPFSYMERSTALRAVMKSVRLTAVDPKAAGGANAAGTTNYLPYSKSTQSAQMTGYNLAMPSVRYPINLDATIEGGFDSRFNSAATPDIFHSASEICNITLVPGDNTTVAAKSTSNHGTEQSVFGSPAVPTSSPTVVSGRITGNAAYAAAATWWNNFTMTGDNERESPYNQIYPRLTTKSNTYCVHMRVQTLIKSNLSAPGTFDESKGDAVTGEYRGSAIVERYIDPNDTSMNGVDFTSPGTSLDQYYKFRVVSTKAFTPQ